MSMLKAIFFTLPLIVIAAMGLAYLLHTQMVQPQVEGVLLKLEAATVQLEQASTNDGANQEALKQIHTKLDTLLARP